MCETMERLFETAFNNNNKIWDYCQQCSPSIQKTQIPEFNRLVKEFRISYDLLEFELQRTSGQCAIEGYYVYSSIGFFLNLNKRIIIHRGRNINREFWQPLS